MGEGTCYTSFDPKAGPKPKLTLLVAGTAALLLIAGILYQVLRAREGGAAVIRRGSQSAETGKAPAGSLNRSTPLAVVNGEVIRYDDVAHVCVKRHGKEILENIINRTIIQQACQEQGIRITEGDVHREVSRIAKRFGLAVDDYYQLLSAERDITPQQYQRDIIWPMLALRKLAGTEVEITQKDLDDAFDRDYGERVKAKIIVFDNERHAREVWSKAHKNPKDFGRLAREYSIDPQSRPLDGKIPPIRQHAGNDALAKAAFELKEGEVSGIIQIGVEQYVILLCEGRTQPIVEKKDFKTVENDLRERLKEEKRQQAIGKLFQRLKKKATITNYLVNSRKEGTRQVSGTRSRTVRNASGTSRAGGDPRSGSTNRSSSTASKPNLFNSRPRPKTR